MTDNSSSGTAAASTAAADLDASMIREMCNAVWATGPVPSDQAEEIDSLLHRVVALLVPELTEAIPRMRSQWQPVAEHVLARTQDLLENGTDVPLWDLAVQCRALLTVHEQSGSLDGRAAEGSRR